MATSKKQRVILISSSATIPGDGTTLTDSRTQTAHGFASTGVAVIDDNGTLTLTQTDGTQADAAAIGIISAIVDANHLEVVTAGYIDGLSGLTPNTIYYAGNDGELISDSNDADDWLTPILVSISSTEGYVVPQIPQSLALIPSSALEGLSTDGTLAGNSDTEFPSEKAVKTYVDAHSGGTGSGNSINLGGGAAATSFTYLETISGGTASTDFTNLFHYHGGVASTTY